MNRLLADWCRAGRIGAATVAAVVVPVWMRTLDEIRRPFEAGGGRVAGLELESAELFRLDNPYWHDDPAVFARGYVRSVTAWGSAAPPPRLRARGRGPRPRSPRRLPRRARGARRGCPRPLPLGLHRGPRHLPEGGRQRARQEALVKLASGLPNGVHRGPHLSPEIRCPGPGCASPCGAARPAAESVTSCARLRIPLSWSG